MKTPATRNEWAERFEATWARTRKRLARIDQRRLVELMALEAQGGSLTPGQAEELARLRKAFAAALAGYERLRIDYVGWLEARAKGPPARRMRP